MFGFLFGRIVIIILLCLLPSWALHGISLLDAMRHESDRMKQEAIRALEIERNATEDRFRRARALLRGAATDPRVAEGSEGACRGALEGAFLEAGNFSS